MNNNSPLDYNGEGISNIYVRVKGKSLKVEYKFTSDEAIKIMEVYRDSLLEDISKININISNMMAERDYIILELQKANKAIETLHTNENIIGE